MIDGSSWLDLEPLAMQSPYVAISYALEKNLLKHKNFAWVKNYTKGGKELDQLRNSFNARMAQSQPRIKFGVQVPRSIYEALKFDRMNGDSLWMDAINTELRQINGYKTFRPVQPEDDLRKYARIPYHFVFDVKFDLRCKSRLVAGGNKTEPPKEDVYSVGLAMDTIRLGFRIAAINNLRVCAADVGNAFLYGKTREKV